MDCSEELSLSAARKYPQDINKAIDWIDGQNDDHETSTMLQMYGRLINMGYPEDLALSAAKTNPNDIGEAIDWLDTKEGVSATGGNNDNEEEEEEEVNGEEEKYPRIENENSEDAGCNACHENDEKQDTLFSSGYVKMTQDNTQPKVYLAKFVEGNRLHLYDEQALANKPEAVLYLSTCKVMDVDEGKEQFIVLSDVCTGIQYKFEPSEKHQDLYKPQGFLSRMLFLKDQCIGDFIFQDESLINARQQFNQFLLHYHRMTELHQQQVPKLQQVVKKAEAGDAVLKDAMGWFQRQKLATEDREIFEDAIINRNKFWNLLFDTRVKYNLCI